MYLLESITSLFGAMGFDALLLAGTSIALVTVILPYVRKQKRRSNLVVSSRNNDGAEMRVSIDADGFGDEWMELKEFGVKIKRERSTGDDNMLKRVEERLHHIASIAADEL